MPLCYFVVGAYTFNYSVVQSCKNDCAIGHLRLCRDAVKDLREYGWRLEGGKMQIVQKQWHCPCKPDGSTRKEWYHLFAARSGHIYSNVHKNYCDHLELDSADRESQRSGIWYIMQTVTPMWTMDRRWLESSAAFMVLCSTSSLALSVPEPVDVDVLEDYLKQWSPKVPDSVSGSCGSQAYSSRLCRL